MTDLIEQIADELATFLPERDEGQDRRINDVKAAAQRHPEATRKFALDLINATTDHPRYELVELPETVVDEMGAPTWAVEQHWNGRLINPGDVRIRCSDGKISTNSVSNPMDCPSDARSLAAALLAAAKAAEEAEVTRRKGGSDE